jgi:hypothetical protein
MALSIESQLGAGHDVGDVGRGRGSREHEVGAGPEESGDAHRGDPDRAGIPAAEYLHRLVTLADIHEIARNQPMAPERGAVLGQAFLVRHAAVDEVEGDPGQCGSGQYAHVLRVHGGIEIHGVLRNARKF